MSELERMICGGLLAYTVSSQPEPRTRVYDDNLQDFLAELAQYIYFNYEQEVLLWVTFCFAAVQAHVFPESSPESDDEEQQQQGEQQGQAQSQGQGMGSGSGTASHFFHHTIMRFKQSNRWSRVETVLKKFLWTDDRVRGWKESYAECVASHRPQGASRESTPSLTVGSSRSERMSLA